MGVSRRTVLLSTVLAGVGAAALAVPPVRRLFHPLVVRVRGSYTVEQRLSQFTHARARLIDRFARSGVEFPPGRVVLLGLKSERRLEVYAGAADDAMRLVAAFPVLAASGTLGHKLREGDRQVPEGVYPLESLNSNSRFHVALRVGYPNAADREAAARDGRTNLGSDIMIHGGAASVGCLAVGDDAAEELFVLAALAGTRNVTIVLSPVDLRKSELPPELRGGPRAEVYAEIGRRLAVLPGS